MLLLQGKWSSRISPLGFVENFSLNRDFLSPFSRLQCRKNTLSTMELSKELWRRILDMTSCEPFLERMMELWRTRKRSKVLLWQPSKLSMTKWPKNCLKPLKKNDWQMEDGRNCTTPGQVQSKYHYDNLWFVRTDKQYFLDSWSFRAVRQSQHRQG